MAKVWPECPKKPIERSRGAGHYESSRTSRTRLVRDTGEGRLAWSCTGTTYEDGENHVECGGLTPLCRGCPRPESSIIAILTWRSPCSRVGRFPESGWAGNR